MSCVYLAFAIDAPAPRLSFSFCTMEKKRKIHEKHWSDTKRYLHIGVPPTREQKKKWICKEVQKDKFVSSYSFMPLIQRVITTSRYRKKYSEGFDTKKVRLPAKEREICYACHLDAIVYKYYAELIQEKYENILKSNNLLDDCIVAYRKVPVDKSRPELDKNKCNIEFAKDAFQFIDQSPYNEVFVGVYDVSNFFNSLDHLLLKNAWIKVCDFENILPNDHYKVFKNTTMYSYIKEVDLFNLFKDRIVCKKNKSSSEEVNRKIKKINYLYSNKKHAIAFCRRKDLKEIKYNQLILDNRFDIVNGVKTKRKKGIPQGLPISAVLANIYMLDFDKLIVEYLNSIGGLYRRYSDDIIIVCNEKYRDTVRDLLKTSIGCLKLSIQEEKEKEYILQKNNEGYFTCRGLKYPFKNKIEYLGFEFDGQRILLKSASIAGFYSRMNRAVKRSKFYSGSIKNKSNGHIFNNQLFKRFSSYGSKRRKIYKQHKNSSGKIVNNYIGKKTWGNYISYVNRAAAIIGEPAIKRQLKRHLPILRRKVGITLTPPPASSIPPTKTIQDS